MINWQTTSAKNKSALKMSANLQTLKNLLVSRCTGKEWINRVSWLLRNSWHYIKPGKQSFPDIWKRYNAEIIEFPFVSTKLRYICFPEFLLNEINYKTGQYKFSSVNVAKGEGEVEASRKRIYTILSRIGINFKIFEMTIKMSLTGNRFAN